MPVRVSHVSLGKLVNSPHVGQATQIDKLVGSVTNAMNSSEGIFPWLTHRRGSPAHQRRLILSLRRSSGSYCSPCLQGPTILRNTPSIRTCELCWTAISFPSHTASPIIHIHLRSAMPPSSAPLMTPNPATLTPRELPSFDIVGDERTLQYIVDEVLAQGVWITHASRLREQERLSCRARSVSARPPS